MTEITKDGRRGITPSDDRWTLGTFLEDWDYADFHSQNAR
jgi:hypothetical protein